MFTVAVESNSQPAPSRRRQKNSGDVSVSVTVILVYSRLFAVFFQAASLSVHPGRLQLIAPRFLDRPSVARKSPMPALEYVAGESMTSSEFSANSEQNWPWPESLDALVAAPDHHAILFENEEVRVIRTRALPGHMVPLHTHRWPCVLFILSWSHVLRRNHLGGVTLDTRREIEVPKLNIRSGRNPCRLTRLKT